jgi:RNA polymerase sigma-70 factor, ECF subfamily
MDRVYTLGYTGDSMENAPLDLEDLWHGARAAWPDIELPLDAFVRHVNAHLPPGADAASLELADLYLAAACARAVPGAAATFDRIFLSAVPRFLARIDGSGQLADEVQQMLRERLLVGIAGEPPQISRYAGQGPLLAWLRVTAVREGLGLLRGRAGRAEVPLDEAALTREVAGALDDDVTRARYREAFEASVASALRALPRKSRSLLRLHLVGGVSTHKLGAIYHVDQSTIVRWLAEARRTVRDAVRARLIEQLRLSPSELDSLAGLLLSRLDLSLAGCLQSQA